MERPASQRETERLKRASAAWRGRVLSLRTAVWPRLREPLAVLLLLLLAFGSYVLLHDATDQGLLDHDPLDSYTHQALAWLDGKVYLENGEALPWLELAIYDGKYYVSFPPVPTLTLLPFAAKRGLETPNTLIVTIYAVLSLLAAYRACRAAGLSGGDARFWAVFTVFGGNLVSIASNGGVWFQAQALNFLLLLTGVDCALRNLRVLSCLALALAVGCRPLSIVYLPVVALYFLCRDRAERPQERFTRSLTRLVPAVLAAALVGCAYLWYNHLRFGNPFEFGHNYLPEFTRAEHGQFSIIYLWNNLKNIFTRGITVNRADATLSYTMFDGFLFYVVNPIFLVWAAAFVRDLVKRRMTPALALTALMLTVNLLALCLHRTFGGWQFGARYTADMIPFTLFYLLLSGKRAPNFFDRACCAFGVVFNAYGAVILRLRT